MAVKKKAPITFTCIPILGKAGGGVQWDAAANKALCRFDGNGHFTTDDPKVIAKLRKLKYKEPPELQPPTEQEEDQPEPGPTGPEETSE